jgi:hypothetical protein
MGVRTRSEFHGGLIEDSKPLVSNAAFLGDSQTFRSKMWPPRIQGPSSRKNRPRVLEAEGDIFFRNATNNPSKEAMSHSRKREVQD